MSNQAELKTSKFSGLGNEILLVDLIRQSGRIDSDSVKKIVVRSQLIPAYAVIQRKRGKRKSSVCTSQGTMKTPISDRPN